MRILSQFSACLQATTKHQSNLKNILNVMLWTGKSEERRKEKKKNHFLTCEKIVKCLFFLWTASSAEKTQESGSFSYRVVFPSSLLTISDRMRGWKWHHEANKKLFVSSVSLMFSERKKEKLLAAIQIQAERQRTRVNCFPFYSKLFIKRLHSYKELVKRQ